jgi:hypothetical protein
MSRNRHLTASGFLVAATAAVLLTACGGDQEPAADASATSSAAGTEASESSASSGGSDFCTQAAGIDQRVESALSGVEGADPSVSDALRQISEELRTMEPPEAIASDWEALAGGLDRMAAAFTDLDITDADSVAALEAAEGDLSTASDNVETYLREECGIEP